MIAKFIAPDQVDTILGYMCKPQFSMGTQKVKGQLHTSGGNALHLVLMLHCTS